MRELANDENFQECIALSDRAVDEQYDMELVLRFLVFRQTQESELKNVGDMGEFLTDQLIRLAEQPSFDTDREEEAFRTTFRVLKQEASSNSFHKYDPQRQRFIGGFLVSAYEAVALGVGYNFESVEASSDDVVAKIKQLWTDHEFRRNSGSGVRASSRVPKIIPYGRRLFAP